jgi:hypothetical protein
MIRSNILYKQVKIKRELIRKISFLFFILQQINLIKQYKTKKIVIIAEINCISIL